MSAEPEMAAPVLEQATDVVARQTVFGREGAEGAAIEVTETVCSGDPQVSWRSNSRSVMLLSISPSAIP